MMNPVIPAQSTSHKTACEHNLCRTLQDMEARLGTVEAYNMMVRYSNALKGRVVEQHGVRAPIPA